MTDSLEKMLIVSAMILAGTLAASAQVTQPTPPSPQAAPEQQQPSPPMPRRHSSPQAGQESDLSRSQGVLTPPPTGDPVVKAPRQSATPSTPVIPPPGTPGGRQDIEPK